ncbi:MAG: NHLP family bacteriocin export ABC transporter peptidase/permease/ATPase subunit [Rhodospirillaceae bacterium]
MNAAAAPQPATGTSPRHRVPSILQLEATECGAASLAMVLAGFGRWMSLDELRAPCGVSRDGAKALNILRAGRAFGLVAKAWQYRSAQSLRALPMPAIVFVNMNHFLVLEGFGRSGVHLNDPAMGRRRMTVEEFETMFSGIAMTFAPGPEFVRGGTPPSVAAMLLHWLKGGEDAFALVALTGALLIVPGLVIPSFTRIFTDYFLLEGQSDWIGWMLLVMAAGVVIQGALSWLRGYTLGRLKTRLALQAGGRFVHRMLRLPIFFFMQRYPGSISNRVDKADELSIYAAESFGNILVGGVSLVFFGLIMMSYHLLLAGVVVGFSLCILASFLASHRFLEEAGQQIALLGNKVGATTMQGLSMLEAMKANGTEGVFFSRWAGQLTLLANQQQRLGRTAGRLSVIPELFSSTATLAVLVIGGVLVMKGELTIGLLVAFSTLQGSFMAAVTSLTNEGVRIKDARGVLDQFQDILAAPAAREFGGDEAVEAGDGGAMTALGRVGRLSGDIRVRGLGFGYVPTEAPLLKDFTLNLAPGSWVALVGGSGCGKSTVGRLVSGLVEPWNGEIVFDGRRMADLPRTQLRDSMAVVDQDIVLFEGSIRDNLTLWDDTVPEGAILRAARDAEIHDDIMLRPGGYDASVAEQGRNFSGGQRQRLEIARALVNRPSILILDEATSALDTEVERRVIANVRRRGCTCLIIAHRLSTIRDCDEIIVLDRGAVLERGTHEDLTARDGPYRRLIQT